MSDLIDMKNEENNSIKWFGFNLTKEKAYYLLVLCIIGSFLFSMLVYNTIEVLLDAPTIKAYSMSIYFQILVSCFSNLNISLIFIGICGYTLKKFDYSENHLQFNKSGNLH